MSNSIFSRLSILYVEDEPLISLDAMIGLEECNFKNLICTYTLKSAIESTTKQEFDCAILDIRLERGLDSIDLGVSLANAGTLVIFASGNGLDQRELKRRGFKHFFIKPYDIHEIISTIETHFVKKQN